MARRSRKHVGLIGLGIIGSRVANALREANFHVSVWSRTPRSQPNFLGSPAEVAEASEVIHVFVSDAQALFDVIEAFEDKLTPRHVILCHATVGPDATIEAARRVAEKGGKFVDAPFTGSKLAAERREIVYYLGGDDDLLDLVEPILRASSKATVRVGHVGQAAAVKIATNMLVAATAQALAETVAIVQRAGVNPIVLEEALEHHAVHSRLIDMKLPMMLQGDYEPHFSIQNLSKDVQLAIGLAKSRDLEIPATSATAEVLLRSLDHGWGDLDYAAVMKAYQEEEAVPPQLTSAAFSASQEPGEEAANEAAESVPSGSSDEPQAEAIPEVEVEAVSEAEFQQDDGPIQGTEGSNPEVIVPETSPLASTGSEIIVDLPPQDAEVVPTAADPSVRGSEPAESGEASDSEETPREEQVPARGLLRRLFG